MVSKKIDDGYLLRLERGEELVKVLNQFCESEKIMSGWVTGLGGVTNALAGYYHLERKKYVFRHIKNVRELTNLTGNISEVGGRPVLHLHGTFTDNRNKAYGGHLKSVEVGGTAEVKIQTMSTQLNRKLDSEVGLPLLDL